jgi:hypothetical protein
MGAPQTLPANFNGWDQAPPTLPANFSGWDASSDSASMPGAPPPKGTLPNKGDTGEGSIAKNLTSFETQISSIPEGLVKLVLAKHWPIVDAKDWTELGNDFKALNPVVTSGGETDWGATAANILPMLADVKGGGIAESPVAGLVKGAAAATPAVRNAAAKAADAGAGLLNNDIAGIISPRAAHVGGMLERAANVLRPPGPPAVFPGAPLPESPGYNPGAPFPEHPGTFPGAPLPAAPPAQLLQARALTQGGAAPPPDPAAALGQIPQRFTPSGTPATGVATTPEPMSTTPSGNTIPRTLNGESALRQILGGQDNANLMKIAKSRGINVTQEAQLKPGVADNRLINKIVDDFSPDELDNLRSTYLENTRMGKHNFGDIGAEAWKTMGMQTYFPDVKVPAATLNRVGKAVTNAAAVAGDDSLLNVLQDSLKKVRAQKLAEAQ